MRIAVIGGGITGMVAARDLARAGHAVTLLEASDALGGLAAGFPLNGTSLEKAYHHLFLTDRDICGLARDLGIGARLRWHPSSLACFYKGKAYPFGGALDLLRFPPLPFLDRLRLGFVVFWLQHVRRWRRFIRVPAAGWLRRWCGERAYRVIWEPLLRGKFHRFALDVSMAWLWARIHTRANSKRHPFARELLGYFDGGFRTLVDALETSLGSLGVRIECAAPVAAIRQSGDVVEVRRVNGSLQTFDRLVATIPSGVFARCIEGSEHADAAYLAKLRSVEYLGAICCVFTSTQSLSPYYWMNIHDVSSPFLVFLQHTNLVGTAPYGGEHVYYLGTYVPHDHPLFAGTEEQTLRTFFDHLPAIFPSFDASAVRQRRLFRLGHAQHVVDCAYEDKIPAFRTPLPGVYLANFSQIFPEDRGTNFAVRDGRRVAQCVLQDIPDTAVTMTSSATLRPRERVVEIGGSIH